jgi:hypothetical protein
MKSNVFDKLVLFLQNLEQQEIEYTLAHHRDEAIMVTVAVPGERWEVEFLSDGSVEVEKFISNGEITGEKAVSELFARYSEQEERAVESPQDTELAKMKR